MKSDSMAEQSGFGVAQTSRIELAYTGIEKNFKNLELRWQLRQKQKYKFTRLQVYEAYKFTRLSLVNL